MGVNDFATKKAIMRYQQAISPFKLHVTWLEIVFLM